MRISVDTPEATQAMQEANRIIEDFSMRKYGLYAVLFLVQVALCFWVASQL